MTMAGFGECHQQRGCDIVAFANSTGFPPIPDNVGSDQGTPMGARIPLVGAICLFLLVSGNLATADAGGLMFRAAAEIQVVALGQVRIPPVPPRGVNPAARRAKSDKDKADAQVQAVEQALPPDARPVLKPLLRWVFKPNAGRAGQPGNHDGAKGAGRDRDYIDSRAPHDLKVEQMMRAAENAIRRQEWKVAQELLQRLLDLPEDSLYRQADGRWLSVRRSANQLLGNAPKSFLEDYRTQYAGLALQLLNEARRSGRTSDYVTVATRFLHTPSGYEAANYLGSLHFDRGEFGLAAVWFDEIAHSTASLTTDGAWRVKAALANRQAGDLSASEKLLEGLSETSRLRVNLGTGGVNPEAWVGGTVAALPVRSLVLSDWTQLYGSVARLGTSRGSEPLLSPLWSLPLTSSHTVRRRLNWILQDLLDQDRTPVLAAAPLVMEGRVVYRDLRGVRAVDLETGKTLWESLEGVSAERILGGLPPQQLEGRESWRFRAQFQQDFNEYQGQSVEYHPLASLLFRDGIYGIISSDGQQVFVIEDHGILSRNQPGQHWGWDGANEPQDPHGVPWKTNRLVSYDLKTGRPRWSVGGADSIESFSLPLAGSFFYGTPAIDGDELLIVAGKGDDLRLWSLDRATGTPRWSQLIAYTDTKIEQDVGRRWFTAQVASDGGVIVCPTTVGWLVAVDRLRQSVLWAYRYLPPSGTQERDSSVQFVPQRDLNSQWGPSAPIISGSVVVYTPPEESIVLALNLLDGRRLWEKPKESWMYLAGVFNDRVVLVGRSEVGAFNVATGKLIWTAPLGDLHPSGRGQAVEDQFYLPLSNGELRVLDLKTGKMLSQGYVPTGHPPLGNLAMHRGKLVALGPQGLVGFGQRDAVMAEIQRRKAQDPQDAWALLREAEVHLLNRRHSDALPLLQAIAVDKLNADEQTRQHLQLVECLATVIRKDPRSHGSELEQLGRLAATAAEKRLFQELTADSLIARGRGLEAFEIFWTLSSQQDSESFVARSDDPQVTMTPRVWLTSRFFELWTAATGADREKLDARVAAIVAESLAANAGKRREVAELLGFHPAAVELQESLIEDLAKAGDFGGAQLELLKLSASSDRRVAARGTLRLARLMEQFQLPSDAAHYYRIVEAEFGDVALNDAATGAELVMKLRLEGKLVERQRVRGPEWDERPLQLVQGPVQYMPPAQEIALRTPLPFFDRLNAEVQPQEQRLAFEFADNGQFSWLTPLRSSPRNQGDGYAASEFLGHEMVLVNRDVVHMVSPVEKRLMWSRALDGSGEGGPFWRHASRPPQFGMASPSRNSESQALLQSAAFTGRLAVVQPNYLCVYGRRSFSVMDPRTGERLWRKDGIPQYSLVIGNRDFICVVPQDHSKVEAYRASDGKLLKIEGLATMLSNALQMRGGSMLLLEPGNAVRFLAFNSAKTVLRLHQPLSGEDRWKMEFPSASIVTALNQDELLVVPPDGKVERVQIHSGKRTTLDPIPATKVRRAESFALMDDDRVYFVANVPDTAGFHHYGESFPSVRANGEIYAWDRATGKLVWHQEVKNQNMVVDRFRAMPLLLFVSRSWKQKGNMSYGTLSVQAIHKRTGTVLHDTTIPSMGSGFHSLYVNNSDPSIEMRSYNLRMRLIPFDGPVAQAPVSAVNPANAPAEPAKKD